MILRKGMSSDSLLAVLTRGWFTAGQIAVLLLSLAVMGRISYGEWAVVLAATVVLRGPIEASAFKLALSSQTSFKHLSIRGKQTFLLWMRLFVGTGVFILAFIMMPSNDEQVGEWVVPMVMASGAILGIDSKHIAGRLLLAGTVAKSLVSIEGVRPLCLCILISLLYFVPNVTMLHVAAAYGISDLVVFLFSVLIFRKSETVALGLDSDSDRKNEAGLLDYANVISMGAYSGILGYIQNIDVMVLSSFAPPEQVADYRLLSRAAAVSMLPASILIMKFSSSYASAKLTATQVYAEADRLNFYAFYLTVAMSGIVILGSIAFDQFAKPLNENYFLLLVVLCAAQLGILSMGPTTQVITLMPDFRRFLWIPATTILFCIVTCAIGSATWGIIGAGLGQFLSIMCWKIMERKVTMSHQRLPTVVRSIFMANSQ